MKSAVNCGSPEAGLEEDTAILRNQCRGCQAARFPGHSSCFRTSGLENQTQFFSLEKAGEAGPTLGLAHPGLSSPAIVLAPEYWLLSGSRASASEDGAWFLPPLSLLGAVPPGWGHLAGGLGPGCLPPLPQNLPAPSWLVNEGGALGLSPEET